MVTAAAVTTATVHRFHVFLRFSAIQVEILSNEQQIAHVMDWNRAIQLNHQFTTTLYEWWATEAATAVAASATVSRFDVAHRLSAFGE